MNLSRSKIGKINVTAHPGHLLTMFEANIDDDYTFYDKSQFHHMLHVEKIRAERSQRPLLLMLLDISAMMNNGASKDTPAKIRTALCPSLREVDIRGWYNYNQTIGVIFTEVSSIDSSSIEVIIKKIHRNFCKHLDSELVSKINIFFHIYPKM